MEMGAGRGQTSFLEDLICTKCRKRYDPRRLWTTCSSCGNILDPEYNLDAIAESVSVKALQRREPTMWRWREFLPLVDITRRVTAGEGGTPLLQTKRLGEALGFSDLYVKDETRNPTGCFKDRGASSVASKLNEHGVRHAVIASEGNASCSLALYAQIASFSCHAYVPESISPTKKRLLKTLNAELTTVNGTIADAAAEAASASKQHGWYNASTFVTPYRHDGKSTMAWEILEQLNWETPDIVVYPVGGGVGLVGMWKAFKHAHRLGWTERLPRLAAVQSEGCAPIVEAFKKGRDDVETWPQPRTIASGLLVPKPLAGKLILKDIRESNGDAVAIPEAAIKKSMNLIARKEGILIEPSSATAFAALPDLLEEGTAQPSNIVVVIATGSGLKTIREPR